MQGCCAGWLSSPRVCCTGATSAATDRRRHTDSTEEGRTHRFWNLVRRFCTYACHTSKRVKVGPTILSWSIRLNAELVVLAIKTGAANVRRIPGWTDGTRIEYSEFEPSHGLRMAVTLHSIFKSEWRGPRRWCLALRGELLMENKVARTHLRRADVEQWCLSEGCPGCRYLRTGQERQQAHREACRKRIEGLLKRDSSGSARLAAADERINRALADAVERHATKDPGMRGIHW